jgi:predicted transcriptional regulator
MTEIHLNFERPIDFLTYQLKQQFYDLSENELRLIAILHLKGLNSKIKKEIVEKQIFKSIQSVENHLTKLRKKGILDKQKINLKNEISISKATSIKINLTLGANKENK